MSDRVSLSSRKSPSALGALSQSPILWGGALTIGFYALIPYLPRYQVLAQRYFCSHPIEYATTYLFFVGIAVLAFKAIAVGTERSALAFELFEGIADDSEDVGELLKQRIKSLPPRFQETWFITRMRDIANYLNQGQTKETLEEHIRYLADRAADKLHGSYALVRTVTWAVPILGFLGTVVGITMAIANISLTELQNSLSEVVGGLSVSFDTTALALTLSLVLVFASFLVERMESQILNEVEDSGIEEIAYRFSATDNTPVSPLMQAEQQASEELLAQSRKIVEQQMLLWSHALEQMRQSWVESLHSQESKLNQAISKSVEQTLERHTESVEKTRADFLNTFHLASRTFSENLEQHNEQLQAESLRRTKQMNDHSRQLIGELVADLKAWQQELQSGTQTLAEQQAAIRKQTELLTQLVSKEASLSSVSERLNQNLAAVTAGNKLEEVLHNLNAAVHLLTAKALPRAGAA